MEQRCKILEEKNNKLKNYKKMVKNSAALQCQGCSKFIQASIFLQHLSQCQSQTSASTLNLTQTQKSSLSLLNSTQS